MPILGKEKCLKSIVLASIKTEKNIKLKVSRKMEIIKIRAENKRNREKSIKQEAGSLTRLI